MTRPDEIQAWRDKRQMDWERFQAEQRARDARMKKLADEAKKTEVEDLPKGKTFNSTEPLGITPNVMDGRGRWNTPHGQTMTPERKKEEEVKDESRLDRIEKDVDRLILLFDRMVQKNVPEDRQV
jgi:hypothetical protein